MRNSYEEVNRYYKTKKMLVEMLERNPLPEELAEELGESVEDIKNYEMLEIVENDNEEFNLKYKLSVKNNNLEKARLGKGYLQKDIEEKVGIKAGRYSGIETCRYYPTEEEKILLSTLLEKSINSLFPEWLVIFTRQWSRAEKEKLVNVKTLGLETPEIMKLEYFEDQDRKVDQGILKDILDNIVDQLSPREQKILEMRFGLNGTSSHSLEETAEAFEVTRERIRQIEAKALSRIKNHPDAYKLKNFTN